MRLAGVLCCFWFIAQAGALTLAQSPTSLPEAEVRDHLIERKAPVYPPIAKAAQIEGDVKISIQISADGRLLSEKVISGPAMLQQAALDAVKEWRFRPFPAVTGPVTSTLTIPFEIKKSGPQPTAEQAKAAQEWFPLSNKCLGSLRAENAGDSLGFCRQALDKAMIAGDLTSSDALGLMLSHQYYGHALLLNGRPGEAFDEEDRAVELAKKHLKDTDEEYAMPFFWRALAEESLGQGEAASADFTTAEVTQRKAIKQLPDMKDRYSHTLAAILKQHAQLLDLMGKPADAAKLRAEAGSL